MTKEREALKLSLKAFEQIIYVFLDTEGSHGKLEMDAIDAAYESIAAIKEVLAQSEQKPVAIVEASWNDDEGFVLVKRLVKSLPKGSCLYTTPPQRTWVGLTDEDIKAVNAQVSQIPPIDYTTTTYAKAIEAKLKEKNT